MLGIEAKRLNLSKNIITQNSLNRDIVENYLKGLTLTDFWGVF